MEKPIDRESTMKGIIAWFASNPVAANLLMIMIIIAGIFSIVTINKKTQPDFDQPIITVRMAYPGAAPADVESGIVIQIEKAVEDVEGIIDITSSASEGAGNVRLEVDESYDINEVMNDVKVRVDGILTFPVDAEPAIVSRNINRNEAMRVEIYGDIDPFSQKELAQLVRDEILDLPSVTTVELQGARAYEISIEVSENTLLKYGLSLDQIAQRIRQSSLDLPAGSLETQGGEILVRTQALAYDYHDFDRIVLITTSDGTVLTLGDIATIRDGFEDSEFYARFNGKPSISLSVQNTANQNILNITSDVREYVAEKKTTLPEGINIDIWADSSYYLKDRLDMMTGNLIMGALLVLIILTLFLELRLAFWVIIGIPVAFLGTFAVMPSVGFDLDMVSLFGFIMVLGIVVDDAIIIGESAHTSMTKYGHSIESVVHGSKLVATPATFGVLTTIAAFMPLLMISGFASAFTTAIGGVVILCLIFSLIESKWILPAHLTHMGTSKKDGWLGRIQKRVNQGLQNFIDRRYMPFVNLCVDNRYITLACFIAAFIVSIGLVTGGRVRTVFLPEIPADFIQASVTMIEGSPEEQARATIAKIEEAILTLNDQGFEYTDTETGERTTEIVDHFLIFSQGASASAWLELDKDVPSQIETDLISEYLQNYVGPMPGLKTLVFSGGNVFGGSPISYQLVGDNPQELTAAATELEARLRTYNGLINIRNDAVNVKDELRLGIRPEAELMGLTLNDISAQVRSAFYGAQAQRLQRGDDEVRVMVRYPEQERVSIGDLEGMYIRSTEGDVIPFSSVAEFDMQPGYASISRVEGKRSVSISSDVIESQVEPAAVNNDIVNDFFPEMMSRYPSVSYLSSGGTAEQSTIIQDMIRGLIFAIIGIYALLAVPLRSYLQPFMIMGVIPFGVVGAVIGHMVFGIALSFMSFLGIIALSGVVVNDSIIIVDFVNRARREGLPIKQAVLESGAARFRAILLTSLTTFAGLFPILTETSLQAQFVIPMACSLAFGILFTTFVTLALIPSLYMILEDVKGLFGRGPVKSIEDSQDRSLPASTMDS